SPEAVKNGVMGLGRQQGGAVGERGAHGRKYVNRDCFLTGRRLAAAARESAGKRTKAQSYFLISQSKERKAMILYGFFFGGWAGKVLPGPTNTFCPGASGNVPFEMGKKARFIILPAPFLKK
ncbi:hypothetical protein, partial [Akkermansia sp.]|uniref:hypothetical protein n=1 Tax=Akkermansia sp. TaxID=1872421 RepID=UPI003AF96822